MKVVKAIFGIICSLLFFVIFFYNFFGGFFEKPKDIDPCEVIDCYANLDNIESP